MRVMYGVLGAVAGVLLSTMVVLAGNLDPPSGPNNATSQMYTLEQIYDRVNDGTAASKMKTFSEPRSGPSGTMHTLDQLYTLVGKRARVPRTGQTTSYATGDDGDLEKGVAWPNPRFTDNGNGTVTDNLTGLMWLQEPTCMGPASWTNWLTLISNLSSGTDYGCANYTAGTFDDWRMPNRFELESLLDLSETHPALPAGHPFINVISYYWSSTTYAQDTNEAWQVDVSGYGGMRTATKGLAWRSWPVRGGQ